MQVKIVSLLEAIFLLSQENQSSLFVLNHDKSNVTTKIKPLKFCSALSSPFLLRMVDVLFL